MNDSDVPRPAGQSIVRMASGALALAAGPAVAGILAAKSLGASGRGQLALALACATIASVVGLRGVDTALLSVGDSLDIRQNERAVLTFLGRRLIRVALIEGVAAGMVFLLVADVGFNPVLFVLVVLMTTASSNFLLRRAVGLAADRSSLVLGADILSSVVGVGAAMVAFLVGAGLAWFLASALLGLVAAAVFWGVRLPLRMLAPTSELTADDVGTTLAPIARHAFVSRALLTTAFRADRIVLGAIAGTGPVGLYAAAVPIGEAASLVPNHLAQLVNLRVAASGDNARWWRCREAQIGITIVVFGGLGVFVFAETIMRTIYGDEFAGAVGALRILSLASILGSLWRFGEAELFGRQNARVAVMASLAAALSVVVGTAVLARPLGAAGVATASVVAYALAVAVVMVSLRRTRDSS